MAPTPGVPIDDDDDVVDVYDDKPLTRIDTRLTWAVFVGHMQQTLKETYRD